MKLASGHFLLLSFNAIVFPENFLTGLIISSKPILSFLFFIHFFIKSYDFPEASAVELFRL
jgi:hypothetical protein